MAQLGITAQSLGGGIRIGMLAILLLLAAPFAAQAEDCSDYPNGLLDGFAGTIPVGVPFTYRLTLPVLFDPGTTTVINTAKWDFDTFEVETQ